MLDQAVVGATGLCALILAARLLSVAEYAAFTLGYSGYMLCYAVHTAVLAEPVMVLAPVAVGGQRAALLQSAARIDDKLTAVGCVLLFASWWLGGSSGTAVVLMSIGAALCTAIAWEQRRRAHGFSQPWRALALSCAQLALFAVGLLVTARSGVDGYAAVIVPLGLSGLLVGAVARPWHGDSHVAPGTEVTRKLASDSIAALARYARAAVGTAIFTWLTANGGYLLLAAKAMEGDVASLRATMNILLPYQHLTVGLGLFFVGAVIRRQNVTRSGLLGYGVRVATRTAGSGIAYGVLIILFGGWILMVAYQGRYERAVGLLNWAPLLAALWGAQGALASVLRGMNRPAAVMWSLALGNCVAWPILILVRSGLSASLVMGALVVLHSVAVAGMVTALRLPGHPAAEPSRRWGS